MDAYVSVKVTLLRTVFPLTYHHPDVFFYHHYHHHHHYYHYHHHHHYYYYDFTPPQHVGLDVKTTQIMSGHRMAGGGWTSWWMGFCSISNRSNLPLPCASEVGRGGEG